MQKRSQRGRKSPGVARKRMDRRSSNRDGSTSTKGMTSRMVGKEFNDREIDGLFVATPPLEAPRLLLSWAATGTDGGQLSTVDTGKSVMIADVSRPFIEAPAKRDICVELPAEALSPGETPEDTVGKLLASLYGTRDASANWQEEVSMCMKEWGVVADKYNPCMFHHPSRQVLGLVHGDDFVSAGDAGQLQWLKDRLKGRLKIKTSVHSGTAGRQRGSDRIQNPEPRYQSKRRRLGV